MGTLCFLSLAAAHCLCGLCRRGGCGAPFLSAAPALAAHRRSPLLYPRHLYLRRRSLYLSRVPVCDGGAQPQHAFLGHGAKDFLGMRLRGTHHHPADVFRAGKRGGLAYLCRCDGDSCGALPLERALSLSQMRAFAASLPRAGAFHRGRAHGGARAAVV